MGRCGVAGGSAVRRPDPLPKPRAAGLGSSSLPADTCLLEGWVQCHLLYCLVTESLLVEQGRESRGRPAGWGWAVGPASERSAGGEGRVCDGTACA